MDKEEGFAWIGYKEVPRLENLVLNVSGKLFSLNSNIRISQVPGLLDIYCQKERALPYTYKGKAIPNSIKRGTKSHSEINSANYGLGNRGSPVELGLRLPDLYFSWDYKGFGFAGQPDKGSREDLVVELFDSSYRYGRSKREKKIQADCYAYFMCLIQGKESIDVKLRVKNRDEVQERFELARDSLLVETYLDASIEFFSDKEPKEVRLGSGCRYCDVLGGCEEGTLYLEKNSKG